jgi:hypothetical protein
VPISFGRPKEDDVVSLIAARNYARAIEVLKQQLRRRGANPSLRMQLADVLVLADKKSEAISLLLPLADEYASEGFAAKAISVLKKVQRIDPRRRDVETRLARLIQEKQREAALPSSSAGRAATGAAVDEGPGLEIGFESMAPVSAPALSDADPNQTLPVDSLPLQPPVAPGPAVLPVESAARPQPAPGPLPQAPATTALPADEEPELLPDLRPLPGYGRGDGSLPSLDLGGDQEIADNDLLYLGDAEEEAEPVLEAEAVQEARPTQSMSAGQFADELMALVDDLFRPAATTPAAPAPPSAPAAPARPPAQIVVSPLFRDFSVDEMVAVIAGLKLLSFERGDVILREGDPGASLYMLTSGRVRAFKREPKTDKQNPLGDLAEGAFFGELSILTGRPRTASVVALSRCELLELDRPTLDGITRTHPHVWDVLREFAARRTASARR